MAVREDIGNAARKLVVPGAASLAGAGAGLLLTKKSMRSAMPDFRDLSIGDLANDLRTKLDSVTGKPHAPSLRNASGTSQSRRIDPHELERRRREREQRRSDRRARS